MRAEHYRIRPGDTLWQIASRFGTDVALLRRVNKLDNDGIRAGDTLLIPGGADASAAEVAGATGYRVRPGDSLYGIASRFKVAVSSIIAWNGLDPDDYLRPGQQLTLYIGDG
jgi:membrane-bound lytic murein transglycosylase D